MKKKLLWFVGLYIASLAVFLLAHVLIRFTVTHMKKDVLKIAQEQKTKGYHETTDTRYQQSLFKIQKRYLMRREYSGKNTNLAVVQEDITFSDIKENLSD